MIRIDFSNETEARLRDLFQNHPHSLVRKRAHALLLKFLGYAHKEIARVMDVCENTVREYFNLYLRSGIEGLTQIHVKGQSMSGYFPFEQVIRQYFELTPPASVKQARAEIEKLTGIIRGETQLRVYIKKLGLKYRKVCGIPAKADVEEQERFRIEQLEPKLAEAKAGVREVYFMDAAHFVLGTFLGFLWSFTRIFVKTPCGRQRFNVLGALNAVTKQLLTIRNNSYITSKEVCQLLERVATQALSPVTIVLDNARYQRCRMVMDYAKALKIELLFLPAYSPNLNLIERVWKLVKKVCLNSQYYEKFDEFRYSISQFIDNAHITHKKDMESLLTLNFQSFKNAA